MIVQSMKSTFYGSYLCQGQGVVLVDTEGASAHARRFPNKTVAGREPLK